MPDLRVTLCGVPFKTPVIAASGTFGFGREFARLYDLSMLGGIAVKGMTLAERKGNPPARVAETAAGMLNSVGLQNPGVDVFIAHELPWLLGYDLPIIANIAGASVEEYCAVAEKLAPTGVHFIELNISCPNVREGGVAFGARPDTVLAVTRAVKACTRQPLIVKLSPNVADIAENALAAQEGGADAISLINTLTGMAVDLRTRRPILHNNTGGLSGAAIKPVALRMVWQASRAVTIPIIGMGGIMTGTDAAEFLMCGASAVMVGTANLIDPYAALRVTYELHRVLEEHRVDAAADLVGTLKPW